MLQYVDRKSMSYKTVKSAADDTDDCNERSPCWIAFITRPISLVFLLPRTCRPQAPPQETRSTGPLWKISAERCTGQARILFPCSHLEPFDFEEVLARFRCPAPWGYKEGHVLENHRAPTQSVCVADCLIFYSKCTGFTVCFTYSDISLTVYTNQW